MAANMAVRAEYGNTWRKMVIMSGSHEPIVFEPGAVLDSENWGRGAEAIPIKGGTPIKILENFGG